MLSIEFKDDKLCIQVDNQFSDAQSDGFWQYFNDRIIFNNVVGCLTQADTLKVNQLTLRS